MTKRGFSNKALNEAAEALEKMMDDDLYGGKRMRSLCVKFDVCCYYRDFQELIFLAHKKKDYEKVAKIVRTRCKSCDECPYYLEMRIRKAVE